MDRAGELNRHALKRPNTIRFNTRHLKDLVTPREIYQAVNKEIGTTATIKCIAPLENGWFNVTFDNERHCEKTAMQGMFLKKSLIQCERANVQNSAVAYIKAPYEMADNVIVTTLTYYGTVTNIRRQIHDFDENIETGVRSCLIKNLKRPIPSYLKIGGFTLPVRYRGQQKTCKVCNEPGHFARDCPRRGRCFICNSDQHRASWHDDNEEQEATQTPIVFVHTDRKTNQRYDSDTDHDDDFDHENESQNEDITVKPPTQYDDDSDDNEEHEENAYDHDNPNKSTATKDTEPIGESSIDKSHHEPEAQPRESAIKKKSFAEVTSQPNHKKDPKGKSSEKRKTTTPVSFWD